MISRIQEWLKRKFPVRNSRRIFTGIYWNKEWATGDTVSGPGSTLEYTFELRKELPALLTRWQIRHLLDAPCGDFHWMSQTRLEEINYTGADVVSELIAANQQKYPGVHFIVADICKDPLPAADAVLCRDCFIHLSNKQIADALANFKRNGIRYLITNTYPVSYNEEIPTGYYRPVNMGKAPFYLPAPLDLIRDFPEGEVERYLGIWEILAEVEQIC